MKEGRMCSGGRVSEERGNGGGRYGGGKPEGQAGEEEKKGGIRGSSTDGRRGTETRSGLRTLEVCCHPGKEHNMEMCGPCIGCIWTERDRQLQTAETVMTWWLHETVKTGSFISPTTAGISKQGDVEVSTQKGYLRSWIPLDDLPKVQRKAFVEQALNLHLPNPRGSSLLLDFTVSLRLQ
ncbi:uncharacterized protein GJ701_006899 isoform 2-T2 [Geothlypis trichas]